MTSFDLSNLLCEIVNIIRIHEEKCQVQMFMLGLGADVTELDPRYIKR